MESRAMDAGSCVSKRAASLPGNGELWKGFENVSDVRFVLEQNGEWTWGKGKPRVGGSSAPD